MAGSAFSPRGTMGPSHSSEHSVKSVSSPLPFPLICKVFSVGFKLCRIQNLKILPQIPLCVKICTFFYFFPKRSSYLCEVAGTEMPTVVMRDKYSHKCPFFFFFLLPSLLLLMKEALETKGGSIKIRLNY